MRLPVLATLVFLSACGGKSPASSKKLSLKGEGHKVVLLSGVSDVEALRQEAQELGVTVEGETILRVSGETDALNEIDVPLSAVAILDEEIAAPSDAPFVPVEGSLYLAKKDFGILEFWRERPEADGRGVVVGVFDDGISPHQSGFRVTTTGARKLLKRGSNSSFNTYTLTKNGEVWEGDVVEDKPLLGSAPDLNGDDKNVSFKARVSDKICLDLNVDGSFAADECKGAFAATGEFFTQPGSTLTLVAEFDAETGKLKISQPEEAGDSHGEGVASVMAGHNQGGLPGMDGVAPGAQIVDYDLSEVTDVAAENDYTMGTILLGLEWLAKNGAEVANISYSLFFTSVEAQDFMAKSIDALVKKYNIVLSFSAGNNGPGLGSLNRKVIYPDSVLVAGAFVSKELDERVWGVTGLPEEGRVVYYSSRGPGPLGDHGPTVISPLSSLTHSSPSEGFRAFNGTSSASPALAGAAAVLISAIKQEGLKVDAPTVVQALRLSGKRLAGEPFVAQGYGLPQVAKALAWYKKLIAGEAFMNVGIRVNRGSQDGIGGRGVLLLKSQSNARESARVDLTGALSALAPVSARTELLTPIKLEYSRGISGARELWVSVSGSRFHIDVDLDEVLDSTSGEGFGEVKIKDARTDEILAIVPVTVLDDRPATQRVRGVITVGPQGSGRLHVHAPAGVTALRVRARLLDGESNGLNIATFDTHRVRLQQVAFTDEVWIPVTRAGHHQVALFMAGGTAREASVEFDVEPIWLELRTSATRAESPSISLRHVGLSSLYGRLEIIPLGPVIARAVSEGGEIKALEVSTKLTTKTGVSAVLKPLEAADTAYFYSNCTTKVEEADGKVSFSDSASYTAPDDKERTVTIRCMPFDHGAAAGHGQGWELTLSKSTTTVEQKPISVGLRSTSDVSLTKQDAGRYSVWLVNILGGQRVKLGEVDYL